MSRQYEPVDLNRLRTISATGRSHKASVQRAARLTDVGASAGELLSSFPDYLGATSFRQAVSAVVGAVRHDRPVVFAFGAHVIKVGCGPILIDLMNRKVIRALSCNGACAIHDVEMALLGETSEEVGQHLRNGVFGMVAETMSFFDAAARLSRQQQCGMGAAIGRLLAERQAPFASQSVFACAHRLGIPACVHLALGTDTVHVSAKADGAALGEASMLDFRLICDVVCDLGAEGGDVGGVWLNVGSAVILPEVFLKAVAVARNLGVDLDAMTTVNCDMIRHYRPHQNVVTRPVVPGRGLEVIGHHEIVLPLFRHAVIEELSRT